MTQTLFIGSPLSPLLALIESSSTLSVHELIAEITSKDPEQYVMSLMNKVISDAETAAETDSDEPDDPVSDAESAGVASTEAASTTTNVSELPDDFIFDEMPIALLMRESLPGLNYGDVDPKQAAFVVASNPLTKTHSWNPMPRNSVMWCTRGKMPELRLLRSKKNKKSCIVSDNTIVL